MCEGLSVTKKGGGEEKREGERESGKQRKKEKEINK